MNAYTFYAIQTGEILFVRKSSAEIDAAGLLEDGQAFLSGAYDPDTFVVVDGNAVIKPVVKDHAEEMRQKRNALLSACDWTQVPDAPVDRAAWAEYRQALRDLPANTTDPRNPNWPTTP